MKYKSGFSLVAALFLLVILSSVAGFTVSIASMSRATATMSLQGTRAYFAAFSGLEWGKHFVNSNKNCPSSPSTSITLNQAGLQGFNAIVTCAENGSFTEGVDTIKLFEITAIGSYSILGNSDYVSRELQVTVAIKE